MIIWMIFMHICDDYYLQGWLAQAKQKKWWEENAPSEMYKNDYIVALLMHSFSWSTMITLPVFVFSGASLTPFVAFALITNCAIHAVVDNLKANLHKINLIQDQTAHIIQILLTAILWSIV